MVKRLKFCVAINWFVLIRCLMWANLWSFWWIIEDRFPMLFHGFLTIKVITSLIHPHFFKTFAMIVFWFWSSKMHNWKDHILNLILKKTKNCNDRNRWKIFANVVATMHAIFPSVCGISQLKFSNDHFAYKWAKWTKNNWNSAEKMS